MSCRAVSGSGDTAALVWAIALPILSSVGFIASSAYCSVHMPQGVEQLRTLLHPHSNSHPAGGERNKHTDKHTETEVVIDAPKTQKQFAAVSVTEPTEVMSSADRSVCITDAHSEHATPLDTASEPESVEWDVTLIRLVLLFACVSTGIAHYARTTYLLGAFMAGVAFSSVPGRYQSQIATSSRRGLNLIFMSLR